MSHMNKKSIIAVAVSLAVVAVGLYLAFSLKPSSVSPTPSSSPSPAPSPAVLSGSVQSIGQSEITIQGGFINQVGFSSIIPGERITFSFNENTKISLQTETYTKLTKNGDDSFSPYSVNKEVRQSTILELSSEWNKQKAMNKTLFINAKSDTYAGGVLMADEIIYIRQINK